jgi:hypothetical protein
MKRGLKKGRKLTLGAPGTARPHSSFKSGGVRPSLVHTEPRFIDYKLTPTPTPYPFTPTIQSQDRKQAHHRS